MGYRQLKRVFNQIKAGRRTPVGKMQGFKMSYKRPTFRRKPKYHGASARPNLSLSTPRVKAASKHCKKMVTQNLNTYRQTMMKNNGFYIYKGLLAGQNAEIQSDDTHFSAGLGVMLTTSMSQLSGDTNTLILNNDNNYLENIITNLTMLCINPYWPGEKLFWGQAPAYDVNGIQTKFGMIGSTLNSVNDNFKPTASPCENANLFGRLNVNGTQLVDFTKINIYNAHLKFNFVNHSIAPCMVHVVLFKFVNPQYTDQTDAARLFSSDDTYININAATATPAQRLEQEWHFTNQLKKGKLPGKMFRTIKSYKRRLGEKNANVQSGYSRCQPQTASISINFPNMKVYHRSTSSNTNTGEGLSERLLSDKWTEDLHVMVYFVPISSKESTLGLPILLNNKVSFTCEKTVCFGPMRS